MQKSPVKSILGYQQRNVFPNADTKGSLSWGAMDWTCYLFQAVYHWFRGFFLSHYATASFTILSLKQRWQKGINTLQCSRPFFVKSLWTKMIMDPPHNSFYAYFQATKVLWSARQTGINCNSSLVTSLLLLAILNIYSPLSEYLISKTEQPFY